MLEIPIAGITEAIFNRLTMLPDTQVISRTSSSRFADRTQPHAQIMQKLQVQQLIVPNIQDNGDQLRVEVVLVSADANQQWSGRFDGSTNDLFALQDDVVDGVIQALNPVWNSTPGTAEDIGLKIRGTQDIAAYQAYLQGQTHLKRRKLELVEPAIEAFSQAVELDPTYARAWAGLGAAHFTAASWGVANRAASMRLARETSSRSIGFAPDQQLGYMILSEVQARYEWDYAGALQTIRAGIEATTHSADQQVIYADLLAKIGSNAEAIRTLQAARKDDPLNPAILSHCVYASWRCKILQTPSKPCRHF